MAQNTPNPPLTMRWLITLLLLVLVAGGGAVLFFPDRTLPVVGLASTQAPPAPTLAELKALHTETPKKIELTLPGQPAQVFENVNGAWIQPGGWELRQEEVRELVSTLANIRTRFQTLPYTDDGKAYGLAPSQKPVQITITNPDRTWTLTFGRPVAMASTTEPEFARPAYLRIDKAAEVVQVGPEVFALISRPTDVYLRKQLFPDARRARFNDPQNPGQPQLASEARRLLLDDSVRSVEINGPDGKYTLSRYTPTPSVRRDPNGRSEEPVMLPNDLAEAWKLSAPSDDRADPAKVQTILTAIPDLWAERFLDPEPLIDAVTDYFRQGTPGLLATVALQNGDRAALRSAIAADITGFTREAIEKQKKDIENGARLGGVTTYKAERSIRVTRTDNRVITLRIGAISRVVVRKETVPPMGMTPPTEREIRTEYRYARFEGNPRTFEVKADKIRDIFVKPEDIADPKLVHFTPEEVAQVTVTVPAQMAAPAVGPLALLSDKPLSVVTLRRVKGKPTAATEKGKKDRWFLGDRLAENTEVISLLDGLTKLEVKSAEDRPYAIAGPGIPVTLAVEVEPKVAEGDNPLPKKTYTFAIAGRDPVKNKLAVTERGWSRLNWVSLGADNPMSPPPPPGSALDELALRPAAVYRSKQLFDTADSTLERITVKAETAPVLTLLPGALGGFSAIAPPRLPTPFEITLPPAETRWELTTPVTAKADDSLAPKLATDLTELKEIQEVSLAPTEKDLTEFGLVKPRFAITLGFRGTDARTETITVGNDVPGKPEVYARRNATGAVFTVSNTILNSFDGGAEALLPRQLWTFAADKITSIGIRRGTAADDTYTLAKTDAETKRWALTGPFSVTADSPQAEALATAVSGVKASRYEPLNVPESRRKSYGLAEPAVKITVSVEEDKKPVTYTLLIGNEVNPGSVERFAKLDGTNSPVFVIPEAVYLSAQKAAVAYLDRKLVGFDLGRVTKLELVGSTPESKVTLLNDGKGWKPEGNAFPVDDPTIFSLINAASRLTALKIVAYGEAAKDPKYGFDKPSHTLTLTVSGETNPVAIQFGKEEPSGERYVRVVGNPAVGIVSGFVVSALTKGKLDVIDRGLFNFDPLLVTGVERKMGTEEMELAPVGRAWEVAKPKKFKADRPMIEALAGEVAGLRASWVAAFAPTDLKPFGLDTPAAVVTFKVEGKDQVLRIGKPVDAAQPNGDRFASTVGSQVVAVIPGTLTEKLLAEPVKFSDRTLNPNRFVDADQVVITRDGRTATFTKKDGVWNMTAPAEASAETSGLEDLIATAAQLRADELIVNDAPPAKLKELGFDPPQGRIVISNAGKEVLNLLVGNKEKAGLRVAVKLDKSGLIGWLDAVNSAKVIAEYRQRSVLPPTDAAQIDAIAFSGGGNFALRRKDAATWEDTGAPMSPVDAGKVAETVAALAGLKAERFVADKDAKLALYGLDKPRRVIVLTLKTGETRILHIGNNVGGPMGKQVYAKVEDKDRSDVFVLSEADTVKVLAERKAFDK